MYYLVIFITLCIFALFEQSTIYQKRKNVLFFISYLMLMLTAGLRYETGGDWTSYTEIFNTIEPVDQVLAGNRQYFDWMAGLETGYRYLNSIVKFIVPNVQLLFFIVAIIISTFIFKGIKQYCSYPILGVLIYFGILFFALDMIVLRQGIAAALVFWGYKYIEDKKFWKFLIICCVASLFHVSALIGILVYFVARPRYPSWLLITLGVAFVGVLVFHIKWMGDIAVHLLSTQIDEGVAEKIVTYTQKDVYAVSRGITLGLLVNIIVFAVLMIRRKSLENQKHFNLFLNLFVIYLFVYCCLSEFVEVGNRLKYYFMISFVVLIPQIVASFEEYRLRAISFVGACMFSLMYCSAQVFERPIASAFNPYQNYVMYEMFKYKSDGHQRLDQSDSEFLNERGQ
ncbi:MAG: EpsG family protein [Mucinivorans sp.]